MYKIIFIATLLMVSFSYGDVVISGDSVTLDQTTVEGDLIITGASASVINCSVTGNIVCIGATPTIKNTIGYNLKAAGSELVVNGTMELDSNWNDVTIPPVQERSAEQAHGGTYSRKFTTDDLNDGIRSDTFTTTATTLYTLTFWIYSDKTRIAWKFTDGAGTGYTTQYYDEIEVSTWTQVTDTFYCIAGGGSANIVIKDIWDDTGTYYIDDVSIAENNTVDIFIESSVTVTGTYNCFSDSAKSGSGTYSDAESTTQWSANPKWMGRYVSNFHLVTNSPCRNTGSYPYAAASGNHYDSLGNLVGIDDAGVQLGKPWYKGSCAPYTGILTIY